MSKPWKVVGRQIVNAEGMIVGAIRGDEMAADVVCAVNAHDGLVDALTLALPYVESALEDKGYKAGVVDRMVRKIRNALEGL